MRARNQVIAVYPQSLFVWQSLSGSVAVVSTDDGVHGPGFHLFGHDHHPTWTRKREYEAAEEKLLARIEKAEDAETLREKQSTAREVKKSVGEILDQSQIDDKRFAALQAALRHAELAKISLAAYVTRVSRIAAAWRAAQERDDIEAALLVMEMI